MPIKRKKDEDMFDAKLQVACTLKFFERVDKASRSKSVPKSYYIRNATDNELKKDGF